MTKLRTSEVSDEAVLFRDERIELFGAPVYDTVQPGERVSGVFNSFKQGAAITGFGYARDQWWTLSDYLTDGASQKLTPERYEEMRSDPYMGKMEIPYDSSLTERQFRNQIKRYRRDQYMQSFDRSGAAVATSFVGAMGGGMLAPEILATLPVGGPLFTAAARAKTTADMLRLSLRGGLQVSAVSTPLNIASQQAVYGEVDPTEVAMTAAAPIAFAPLGAAFGRLFTRQERAAAADAGANPLPQPVPEPPDTQVPSSLMARFDEFDGGVESWLAKYAARDPEAIDYARAIGMDERAIDQLNDLSWREAAASPLDTRSVQDVEALTAYAAGQESPEQLRWLWARGLTDNAEAARVAQGTAPFQRTIDDLLAKRDIEQRRTEVLTRFPELEGALKFRDFALVGGRTGATSDELRLQAETIDRAVREGNAGLVPPEFRELAERLIIAESKDRGTQRIAYRTEMADRKLIAEAARDDKRLSEFAGRFIRELPQDAKKDFEAFNNGGLEAVRVRHAQRLENQLDEQVARLGEMAEQRAGKKGRASKEFNAQKKAVQASINALQTSLARIRSAPVREPASISVDQLAQILNAAGVRNKPDVRPVREPMPQQAPARQMTEQQQDAMIDEYEQLAREAGVDISDIETEYSRAANALRNCG